MFVKIRAQNRKFIKKETRIPMFEKGNKSYNVLKDTARIPRCTGIVEKFQFGKIKISTFRRIRLELPCLEE